MVNYCCVYGCGRNNKIHKHLTYYGIPKDKDRQEQWLRAAGREDLMGKASYKSVRLCSRHFEPSQIKKRHLAPDAVPSLCLPGSLIYDTDVKEPETHNGLICNGCSDPIVGFRYKCIVCNDYDLCQKCEMLEVHPEHLMLRINRPLKFSTIENLVNKWRNVIKSAKDSYDGSKAEDDNEYQSSDDEPITKYTRENDGGVNLSEEVKNRIRKEIARVLKIRNEQDCDKSKINANKRPAEGDKPSKKMRKEEISDDENDSDNNSDDSHEVQELAFADVDDVKLDKMIKTETSAASSAEQDKDNMYLDITLNSFNFN